MGKADADPRARDVADAGRDRANAPDQPPAPPSPPPRAGSPNVKSQSSATSEEDIPPVHVLEAAQKQDRREAEDLLAGFDRPGRSPKPVSKERDFVDYYAKKKKDPSAADAESSRASKPITPQRVKQVDVATVIKPRTHKHKREGTPAWLAWPAVGLLMLAIGGVVAYLGTADRAPTAAPGAAPDTATTITVAPVPSAGDDKIPPPDPATPLATGTTTTAMTVVEPSLATAAPAPVTAAPGSAPRASAKREPRVAPTGGTAATTAGAQAAPARTIKSSTATDGTKPPPRDDFIRDM